MKYELRIHIKNGCYNYIRCEEENYKEELEKLENDIVNNPDVYYPGVTTLKLYKFSELDNDAKEIAIEDIKHNHLGYYEDDNCNKVLHSDENVLDYIWGNSDDLFFSEEGDYIE